MTINETPMRIVYLDRDGLPARIQIPAPVTPHEWINYGASNQAQAIKRSEGADLLVVNKVNVTSQLLDACPTIKHVAVTATGYNVVDTLACEKRGISVSNIPSYAATTVSEHVIGSAIVLRREIFRYRQSVQNGEWQQSKSFCLFGSPFNNVERATIGLIGLGEIGSTVAKKARALGMNVIFTSRTKKNHDFAKQVSLEALLECSDIVSIHCDFNASTESLLGSREIDLMPKHSILINTARGGIVDEVAAVTAIKEQTIAGIAFDVLTQEPPADNAPLLSVSHLPNVLITPHIAWASEQAMQYLANTVTKNIDAFANGSPINLVNNPYN